MTSKVTIEISEYSSCKVVLEQKNGIKSNKNISYNDLLKMLNSATIEKSISGVNEDYTLSDILPGDKMISTIQIKEIPSSNAKWYILLRESVSANMKLYERTYENVAMPRTLYAIKVANNKCVSLRICCVKDNFINRGTAIYRYPYSNVYDTRSVCLGGNRINDFDLQDLSNIVMIPEMFLAMDNNRDGYSGSNNTQYKYEELLELMSNAKFDNEILRRSQNTPLYQDFINSLK